MCVGGGWSLHGETFKTITRSRMKIMGSREVDSVRRAKRISKEDGGNWCSTVSMHTVITASPVNRCRIQRKNHERQTKSEPSPECIDNKR